MQNIPSKLDDKELLEILPIVWADQLFFNIVKTPQTESYELMHHIAQAKAFASKLNDAISIAEAKYDQWRMSEVGPDTSDLDPWERTERETATPGQLQTVKVKRPGKPGFAIVNVCDLASDDEVLPSA